jgi:hypothetical protein
MAVPALVIPSKTRPPNIPIFESRVPKPEELVVLSKALLEATVKLGELLKDCSAKWAIAGDLGEILFGVNVQPDRLTVLTTAAGCEEISKKLATFQIEPPRNVEKQIMRDAKVEQKHIPVLISSYTSRFDIGGQRLDVYGDLRIQVGAWGWGDPLDFEPENVYVVGVRTPVVPLELKQELYMGLGWMDRVRKINEAMARRHHKIV